MKFLLLLIIVFLASCNSTEGIWDELSPAEQDDVANRSENECRSGSQDHFDELKSSAESYFYGSAVYSKGATWSHEFKNGTDVRYSYKITVWKTTATDLYLVIYVDDTTDEYRFVKIPLTTNQEMVDELQDVLCTKDYSNTTLSRSSSSGSIEDTTTIAVSSSSSKRTTKTLNYSFNIPIYFMNFSETRKEELLDSSSTVTTTTTYTGTLTKISDSTSYPAYDTYAEFPSAITKLCLIKSSTTVPFELDCDLDVAQDYSAELDT